MSAEAWSITRTSTAAVPARATRPARERRLASEGKCDRGGNTELSDVRHNHSPEGNEVLRPSRSPLAGIVRTTMGRGSRRLHSTRAG
jgi:hypothetical protein